MAFTAAHEPMTLKKQIMEWHKSRPQLNLLSLSVDKTGQSLSTAGVQHMHEAVVSAISNWPPVGPSESQEPCSHLALTSILGDQVTRCHTLI